MLTQCPNCKIRFQVSNEHKGQKARCTKCKQPFDVIEYADSLSQTTVESLPPSISKTWKSIITPHGIFSTIIGVLLGVISTVTTIFIAIVIVALTGYYLHSFSLFFVIPVGALFTGALCSSGLFWGLRLTYVKAVTVHDFIASFLGILGLVGIYYGLYATAYVSSDKKINHVFEGEHISNFIYKDTGEPVAFKSYLIDEIKNRQTTFIVGVGKGKRVIPIPLGSVGLPSVLNWIDFVLEVLGFAVGSIIIPKSWTHN